MGVRTFRPRLWSVIATAVCVAGCIALANWQLDRARQKRERVASYGVRQLAPVVEDARALRAENVDLLWRRVRLHGRFDAERQVLLDNQVLHGQAGYQVLTPFELAAGVVVLVDRGWIAAPSREAIPAIAPPNGALLEGNIAPPPATGIRLAGSDAIERLGAQLIRVQRVDMERLQDALGLELSPWLVYSNAAPASGLQAVAPEPVDRGERHSAYAVQWFSFAAIAVALFFILNWRTVDPSP